MSTHNKKIDFDQKTQSYYCKGDWSILKINDLFELFNQQTLPQGKEISIDGQEISRFDSAGAITLLHCVKALKSQNNTITLKNFDERHQDLYQLIEEKQNDIQYTPPDTPQDDVVTFIGKQTIQKLNQANGLVVLIGDLFEKLAHAFHHWRQFQFPSIVTNIYNTGVTALPIIAILSFLIGVVLAYQMGIQLESYGANVYIAFLAGMAIFREFSPLITAIIVAGRTSSSFTAQLGSMKINEEIDALNTMGLSPTQLLVVPKVLALLLIFPLLIFWSDFFSTLGAMIMSKSMLNVGYVDFLTRLKDSVGLDQLVLGLYKAPAFAILIALVGCFQGFRVEANADSLGTQTTKSVVQALFLIIIADAAYSIIYSWLKL